MARSPAPRVRALRRAFVACVVLACSALASPPAGPSAPLADALSFDVRVDAPSPTVVVATTRRPGVLNLVAHSRLALHKMFHHVVLEIHDDGGFAANGCALHRVQRVDDGPPRGKGKQSPPSSSSSSSSSSFRSTRVRARKPPPGYVPLDASEGPPDLIAMFGPFANRVAVTPRCKLGGPASSDAAVSSGRPLAYRARLRASAASDPGRRAKLLAGLLLLALAPTLAESVSAYYACGAALSVTALILVAAWRFSRSLPGGRAARAGAYAVALGSALFVPGEHLSFVLEGYASLCSKPLRVLLRVMWEQNPEDASLPWALAATTFLFVGAGAGAWAVRANVVDPGTGGIYPTVQGFVRILARVLAAVMFQFCTLDLASGAAMAVACLAFAAREELTRGIGGAGFSGGGASARRRRRGGPRGPSSANNTRRASDERRRRGSDSDAETTDDDVHDDDFDDERIATATETSSPGREAATAASALARAAFSFSPSDWFGGGVSRRRRAGAGAENERPRPASSSAAAERRRLRTMDPEPNTPPAPFGESRSLARRGGGSPGRTPGGGAHSRRRGTQMLFSPGRSSGRSPLGAGAAGADSFGMPTPSGADSQKTPPAGSAANARGRFLTRAEFDAMGARETERGLDELCGTPEFARWMRRNAARVRLKPEEGSEGEATDGEEE